MTSLIFVLGSFTFASAAEVNVPGFSGTVNTTVTTGLSVRLERNCLTEPGAISIAGDTTYINAINAQYDSTTAAAFLDDGFGCAKQYTDGYGNTPDTTSGPRRKLLSSNANDGNMNFDGGDIFDSTTRLFSEIMGTTDAGVDVKLSFVGAYNPVTNFTNPTWAPFTSDQKDEIETNIDLLDAYITTDIESMDATLTAGQFVTNWGESTFIPIGMNGLVTNAVDLTKLRVPGASIKEALTPTPQLTLSGYLDGGWSYEAYYQIGESHVNFDTAGTYFGNEVISGDRLTFTSAFSGGSQAQSDSCNYALAVTAGMGCTAATVAYAATDAGKQTSAMYQFQEAFNAFAVGGNIQQVVLKSAALGSAAATSAAIAGDAGDINTLVSTQGAAGVAGVMAGYAAWDEYTRKQGRKVGALDASGGNHTYADGDGQFGLALRTYLDDVGSGVDLGIYFAQYDSKVPYLRFKGQQGIHAGDLLGFFTLASACATELTGGDGCDTDAGADFTDGNYKKASGTAIGDGNIYDFSAGENAALLRVGAALLELANGEAGCGAYQNPAAVNKLYGNDAAATASNFAWSDAQKSNALTYYNYTNVGGKLYHDSQKCFENSLTGYLRANFGTSGTQNAAAALLGAAVTPLNVSEYEFIYPEDLQVIGISANTNIGPTTVQAEVAYRPDFPLATDGGDQGQQLSDAAGTSGMLSIGVAQTLRGGCAAVGGSTDYDTVAGQLAGDAVTFAKCAPQIQATAAYRAGQGDNTLQWGDVVEALKDVQRSSLPRISLATVAAGDYYTTPYWEYDVWTATIGTTSSFSASHPVTSSLGADSSVLLTEFGAVIVPDLDNSKQVARGGYRDGVGGDRCGGVTGGGALGATNYGALGSRALDGATHIGSSQTDPLFGNGSYCESKNSADSNAFTYRVIGSATYNNVANSAWTFSPSFVWSHDFQGYSPSTMGGFVPGKQSLSLSGSLSKGDVTASLNYVNQMGDEMDNLQFDRDYVSASVSYAF